MPFIMRFIIEKLGLEDELGQRVRLPFHAEVNAKIIVACTGGTLAVVV